MNIICRLFGLQLLTFWIFVTEEVGNTAAFLASPLASAITGAVIYVDNGLNAMGVGVDSPIFKDLDIPKDQH
jgi:enoyl-[acyl-carrier protein] reductase I